MTKEKVVQVIGIGNITRKDDGVAIKIIQELEKKSFSSEVKLTDLGTGGINIALQLAGWKYAIIIDAVKMNDLKPGQIIEFNLSKEQLPEITGLSSTHGFDVVSSLKLAYAINDFNLPEEMRIIGIQIENIQGFGFNLSKEVSKVIPEVIKKIEFLIHYYLNKRL